MKYSNNNFIWLDLFLALVCFPAVSVAAQLSLQWNPVEDTRVLGYTVYYGTQHLSYDHSINVGNTTSCTVTDLDPNSVYYFAVTANDGAGGESDFSSEVTSGKFRFTVGPGVDPASAEQLEIVNLEVANQNKSFEQQVPIGWAAYNAQNGEARVATGDIDGDGKDEIVIGFGPADQSGLPGGRFEILDDDYTHLFWGQVDWYNYNVANGETRPAVGDVDGDGMAEIFIGLGPGGGGWLQGFRVTDGTLSSIGWTYLNWWDYGQANGETWPALGDIDGDNKADLAIGLGNGSAGTFMIKKGFDEARQAAGLDPWLYDLQGTLFWADYAAQVGESRAALGDLDGDGKHSVVLGLGESGGGNVEIHDVISSSLVYRKTLMTAWSEYNVANGETRPVIGDIDADGRGELIVGLGNGGGGYIGLFDDSMSQYTKLGNLRLGSTDYQTENGAFWPAVKREVVGLPQQTANYVLSVTKTGTGSGTVGGGGTYQAGTTVNPTAVAAAGSNMAGWTPTTCGVPFELNADTTCMATFTLLPTYSLTIKRSGSGTVSSVPSGIDCGSDCLEVYSKGTVVTLTATPGTGYKFSGWSGACTGSANCTVTMSAAKSATATFAAIPKYSLTVKRSGSGTVTSAPSGIDCGSDCTEAYSSGTAVTLTATPATNRKFSGWSGACTGILSCTMTMSANKSVTATFK
jgi:hypothetical protein